jgi:hypothetical protein
VCRKAVTDGSVQEEKAFRSVLMRPVNFFSFFNFVNRTLLKTIYHNNYYLFFYGLADTKK